MTRNGIEYNLGKSTFLTEINGFCFHFSSLVHKENFENKMKENRKKISESLSSRFKINIDSVLIADIVLYQKIETRGFYIKYNNFTFTDNNAFFISEKMEVL